MYRRITDRSLQHCKIKINSERPDGEPGGIERNRAESSGRAYPPIKKRNAPHWPSDWGYLRRARTGNLHDRDYNRDLKSAVVLLLHNTFAQIRVVLPGHLAGACVVGLAVVQHVLLAEKRQHLDQAIPVIDVVVVLKNVDRLPQVGLQLLASFLHHLRVSIADGFLGRKFERRDRLVLFLQDLMNRVELRIPSVHVPLIVLYSDVDLVDVMRGDLVAALLIGGQVGVLICLLLVGEEGARYPDVDERLQVLRQDRAELQRLVFGVGGDRNDLVFVGLNGVGKLCGGRAGWLARSRAKGSQSVKSSSYHFARTHR